MNRLGIESIMLDTSFCIRLMDANDKLHSHALEYFKFFLQEKIIIHLSTIVAAEYAVGDDPQNLPLDNLQIETFDFRDAATAGLFHRELMGNKTNIAGYNRRIIANDVKILAQIKNREIQAIISKDVESLTKYVNPLINSNLLSLIFIDLNKRLNEELGELFPI
ncbi:MAG: PIN domain-containing protein [Ginsengibacter sp.]